MELPGGLTPSHLIGLAIIVVVLIVLKKALSKKEENPHVISTRCASCGWSGSVSRHKPICPKCASPLRP